MRKLGTLLHEQSVHMVGNFRMKGGSDVAVGVEGERDRAVAEEFLDHLGMHAAAEEMRCRGVPEVMNPNPRQTCLIERSVKPFDHPRSVGWSPNRCCED